MGWQEKFAISALFFGTLSIMNFGFFYTFPALAVLAFLGYLSGGQKDGSKIYKTIARAGLIMGLFGILLFIGLGNSLKTGSMFKSPQSTYGNITFHAVREGNYYFYYEGKYMEVNTLPGQDKGISFKDSFKFTVFNSTQPAS